MTWISGSLVGAELPLELEASCAATVLGAIASTAASAQRDPRNSKMRRRNPRLNDTTYCPVHAQSLMQVLSNDVTILMLAVDDVFQGAQEHLANLTGTFGKR
jgi:hypothetical protein